MSISINCISIANIIMNEFMYYLKITSLTPYIPHK